MAPPRKKTPSRDEVLRKLERAGVPIEEVDEALHTFYEGKGDESLRAAIDRRKQAESWRDNIVACADEFRTKDSHPVQRSVQWHFQRVVQEAEELVLATIDEYIGELAVVRTGLGMPLQARTLVEVINRLNKALTYPEIAVLLVDGLPGRRRMRPEHRVYSEETREKAIDRVANGLRTRASRGAK